MTTATLSASDIDLGEHIETAKRQVGRFIQSHPSCARHRDDLISEAMLALVKARNKFSPECGDFQHYAMRCVRKRLLLVFARRLVPNERMITNCEIEIAGNDPAEENSTKDLVEECLKTLPDRDRQIVEMKFLLGMNGKEISERAGVAEDHVRKVVGRSLAVMRRVAEAKGGA